MSTTHSGRENPTDATIAALPRYKYLGIDREQNHHVLDRGRNVVHRIDPLAAERERVTDLRLNDFPARGNAVEAYVHDFVGAQIGWNDRALTNRDFFGAP